MILRLVPYRMQLTMAIRPMCSMMKVYLLKVLRLPRNKLSSRWEARTIYQYIMALTKFHFATIMEALLLCISLEHSTFRRRLSMWLTYVNLACIIVMDAVTKIPSSSRRTKILIFVELWEVSSEVIASNLCNFVTDHQ